MNCEVPCIKKYLQNYSCAPEVSSNKMLKIAIDLKEVAYNLQLVISGLLNVAVIA